MKNTRPETVAFVGGGRLARALIHAFRKAGIRTAAVAAPRLAEARSAARLCSGALATQDPLEAACESAVLLLAVPDAALGELAADLARGTAVQWSGRVVLHHAGALGPEVLGPLRSAGASVGVLHPLQSLVGSRSVTWLAGSAARIEGVGRARSVARSLARSVGLAPLGCPSTLTSDQRTAYHAAASLAANDTVALLATAVSSLESLGLTPRAAWQALEPLVRGTLEQFGKQPGAGPLSGPAARGDVDTVLGHLASLSALSTEMAEAHRQIALHVLREAAERGADLPPGARRRLERRGPTRPPKL